MVGKDVEPWGLGEGLLGLLFLSFSGGGTAVFEPQGLDGGAAVVDP